MSLGNPDRPIFLDAIDEIVVLRPEDTELVADTSSRYANTRLYLESLFRRTPATDAAIHLGHRAAITPVDYQLRPAARALGLLRPRFLMADGVGLGKTIEVGVLLTELIRRGRGRRILVVAMKSILAQFQEELWGRFTIPLVRLDSVGVQRVQSKIPSSMNPFHFFDRVIVSVDTLKNDVKYRQHLENCRWDVIVVDECQNVAMRTRGGRGQGSRRAQLAKMLASQCDALILTSATPHDGSPESFASLVRLLEPTAIADEKDFTHEEVADFFQRKFKKDVAHEVAEAFPEREMTLRPVDASSAENAFIERLQGATFQTIDSRRGSGGILFRTTLLKAFLSSPQACISTINKRLGHKAMNLIELTGDARKAAVADQALLLELRGLAEAVTARAFPKFRAPDMPFGPRRNDGVRLSLLSGAKDPKRGLQELKRRRKHLTFTPKYAEYITGRIMASQVIHGTSIPHALPSQSRGHGQRAPCRGSAGRTGHLL